jgi:transcriptional regulator with XRE-family HTH domain
MESTKKMTFGERIKTVREALGLNQSEFGRRLYYAANNINQMESSPTSCSGESYQQRIALCIKATFPQYNKDFVTGYSEEIYDTVRSLKEEHSVNDEESSFPKDALNDFSESYFNESDKLLLKEVFKEAAREAMIEIEAENTAMEKARHNELHEKFLRERFALLKAKYEPE